MFKKLVKFSFLIKPLFKLIPVASTAPPVLSGIPSLLDVSTGCTLAVCILVVLGASAFGASSSLTKTCCISESIGNKDVPVALIKGNILTCHVSLLT